MKYRKKPVEIEAITFDELIKHGRDVKNAKGNEIPMDFKYKGHPITHENDNCYLIPTLEGIHNMTPDDMLITGVKGEIYPCKKDIFELTYDLVDKSNNSLGSKRVKADFNPAKNDLVDKIKNNCAEVIDLFEELRDEGITSEAHRLISIAQTKVETGCMCGVKACFKK